MKLFSWSIKKQAYKMFWYLHKHKSMQAKELDLLKGHNAAIILKLESSAWELKEKNKELEQLPCLLEDETITTFENGKYIDEVREVIMDLFAKNVFMSKVNEEIPTVLQKLGGKSISRLPSKAVHLHLLIEANRCPARKSNVKSGWSISGNWKYLHGDGTTKYHIHYQDFEVTTPYC